MLIWNLVEMLSVVYRIKQMLILLKHIPLNTKIRGTDHFAAVSFFPRAVCVPGLPRRLALL